jgi:hypothetical protein
MYIVTYGLCLYVSVTRQSEGNDCRNRVMSKYIISTYGELSLLQALDSFVSSQSQVAIAILSRSYSLHTINLNRLDNVLNHPHRLRKLKSLNDIVF